MHSSIGDTAPQLLIAIALVYNGFDIDKVKTKIDGLDKHQLLLESYYNKGNMKRFFKGPAMQKIFAYIIISIVYIYEAGMFWLETEE